jgi:hypothetical protein
MSKNSSNKSNVEIQITLQFENQYSGDGNTEPTREQVREALIDFANNNLTYSEKRTPISPEKDAWNVHNDIVTGYYEQHKLDESKYTESDAIDNNRTLSKNAYLLNEEPVSSPLDTFKSLEDAIAQTHKAKTLGRDSEEQGGNRSKNKYNTDRDPLNED